MNREEKKIAPPRGELKNEELEEISGGVMAKSWMTLCRCPNCNKTLHTIEGSECPLCRLEGKTFLMVKVSTLKGEAHE